jgi:outer membrane lipoprotein LolB
MCGGDRVMRLVRVVCGTLICVLGLTVGLTACVTAPNEDALAEFTMPWAKREAQLQSITRWIVNGSVAIAHLNQAWNFGVRWHERKAIDYQLHFFSPFGSPLGRLDGFADKVRFTDTQGNKQFANSPDALIYNYFHWQLPVRYLRYWLRGLPVPEAKAKITWDKYHRIEQLQQYGWEVHYKRYRYFAGVVLPGLVELRQQNWRIRIVAAQWQIGGNK